MKKKQTRRLCHISICLQVMCLSLFIIVRLLPKGSSNEAKRVSKPAFAYQSCHCVVDVVICRCVIIPKV